MSFKKGRVDRFSQVTMGGKGLNRKGKEREREEKALLLPTTFSTSALRSSNFNFSTSNFSDSQLVSESQAAIRASEILRQFPTPA
jgi:hypothetical protein